MDNLIWRDTLDDFGGICADYLGCKLFVYPTTRRGQAHWTINPYTVSTHAHLCLVVDRTYDVPYKGDMEEGKRIVVDIMNKAFLVDYFRIS